jgi:HPt (histidine-containing phosphotransfer) domain-containing protein
VPPQNPTTRIRQVAAELEQLGEELEGPVGPDAKRALMRWHDELLEAVAELEDDEPGSTASGVGGP